MDVSVSTVTIYGTGGVQFPGGTEKFLFFHSVQTDSGAYAAFCPKNIRNPFLEVKRLKREDDHSRPHRAKINMWSYTYTPLYVFMILMHK
jgi:hypothetical protein